VSIKKNLVLIKTNKTKVCGEITLPGGGLKAERKSKFDMSFVTTVLRGRPTGWKKRKRTP